jgi:hypothetical protein
LRNSPRFSRVWVGSVTGTSGKGFNFEFSVTK